VTVRWFNVITGAAVVAASIGMSGCGEFVRESRSPSQIVLVSLEAASGAEPDTFGSMLHSDVETIVLVDEVPIPTIFSDPAEATFRLRLRDPGIPGLAAAPSLINEVTINRYRVVYRRTDGRNTPGVDVPQPIDSAVSMTIPSDGTATVGFEIVRHVAKQEAPLRALRFAETIISTIAEVTFYGRDGAGNEVSVSGNIGINFGNFGDPQ
jgi:hypothetical protein